MFRVNPSQHASGVTNVQFEYDISMRVRTAHQACLFGQWFDFVGKLINLAFLS
jgi:hypothetical protein